jgi:hypothetical protein
VCVVEKDTTESTPKGIDARPAWNGVEP